MRAKISRPRFPSAGSLSGVGGARNRTNASVRSITSWLISGSETGSTPSGIGFPAIVFFCKHSRARDTLFDDEGAVVEFPKRQDECLATEATKSSVEESIWATRDPIAIPIVGISQSQNRRVRYGIEEPEAKNIGGRPEASSGGFRRDRFAVDAEGSLERGCDVLLHDRAALLNKGIAKGAGLDEGRGVHLHFVAGPAGDGTLMAYRARFRIEERTQPTLRTEDPLELGPPSVELVALLRRKPIERVAKSRGFTTRRDHQQGSNDACAQNNVRCLAHPLSLSGVPTVSMLVATLPSGVLRYLIRTISPRLRSPSRPAAPVTMIRHAGSTCSHTNRSA